MLIKSKTIGGIQKTLYAAKGKNVPCDKLKKQNAESKVYSVPQKTALVVIKKRKDAIFTAAGALEWFGFSGAKASF